MSVDLQKAFDRVEHAALFEALTQQMDDLEYVALLKLLYKEQIGIIGEQDAFPISRGVRQGDVLSPVLFNAVLEKAISEWKLTLSDEGLEMKEGDPNTRLTNIRYADDLLLFGRSYGEAVSMIESLAAVLARYGLQLNDKKTKILTTVDTPDVPTICITSAGAIELITGDEFHKYLGRGFTGKLRNRGKDAVEHRVRCAWCKYNGLKHVLENKNVGIRLRFRLLDAVVAATALYSLDACPITSTLAQRLDTTQRKMLRRMVGWISSSGATYEERGHLMKHRLQRCLEISPMTAWSEQLQQRKAQILQAEESWPHWTKMAHAWQPSSSRPRGRPQARWHDGVLDCNP